MKLFPINHRTFSEKCQHIYIDWIILIRDIFLNKKECSFSFVKVEMVIMFDPQISAVFF